MYFLEYNLEPGDVGYCSPERKLGIRGKNREQRDFNASDDYEGRRVEAFHTQGEAEYLISRFSGSKPLFRWCDDLLSVKEQEKIADAVAAAVEPLCAAIGDIDIELGKIRAELAKKANKRGK